MRLFSADSIFRKSGFIPFLFMGFLNAFVDLGHKIIIQNTIYKTYADDAQLLLSALINLLILLPFVLLFSPSGFLSDKYPKNEVMKKAALVGVGLTICILFCYYNGLFWLAFIATFLMAMQSAIYSPAKFGYIKELLGKDSLVSGNGALQAVSIVAILSSIALFSLLFEGLYSFASLSAPSKADILQVVAPLGFLLVIFSVIELVLAYKIPKLREKSDICFDTQSYMQGKMITKNLKAIKADDAIWLCILGLAFFFALSQIYLAAFPVYAKSILGVENTFFANVALAFSGIGIIFGAIMVGKLSKHYIELGFVPLGMLGIFVASIFIATSSGIVTYMMIFFAFGICGAFFMIPLNALIQFRAKEDNLGLILAGNNFIQNIAMIGALIFTSAIAYWQVGVNALFYLMIAISLFGAYLVPKLMPFSLVRLLVTLAFFQRYRLIVEGFKNFPERGGVLLLGNHISFIDWAIVQMALPRKVFFMMERSIYSRWYIKIFLDRFGVIPVSNANVKGALGVAAQRLKEGKVVCIFPEGSISRHGHLNEFKSGFEIVARNLQENDACILPFYIRGLWGSSFSRSDEQFQLRYRSIAKRKIAIAFGVKMPIHSTKESVKAKVFELSFKAWESQCRALPSIDKAWIESAKKYGSKVALVDSMSGSFSYYKLLALSLAISKEVAKNSKSIKNQNEIKIDSNSSFANAGLDKERIGIVLPASLASTLCNFSLLLANKIVINLNFTSPPKHFELAIQKAQITQIYTSKQFIEKLKGKGIKLTFPKNVSVYYMEDVVGALKARKIKLVGYMVISYIAPAFLLKALFTQKIDNTEVATILFSSGSEGIPKGVMLNHFNIMGNIYQCIDALSIKGTDVVLSSLPPFHAFGLTVTTFLPLIAGIPSITCPDPTDSVSVAKAVARNKITIMCATSSFLGIYARNPKLEGIMFESLRLVVAGAERLKDEVRQNFTQKFNKPIYEGYGATETTPVASVNLPTCIDEVYWELHKANKIGSVGLPLPGTAVRIVNPETLNELPIGESGLVLIGGHQVMVGYLDDEKRTKDVILDSDGIRWYKSGDKGYVDEDGFLHIVDRYARFAKIGGEMVSLGALESQIANIMRNTEFDNSPFAAINVPDLKKGEAVVLLIENKEGDTERIRRFIERVRKSEDISALYKPAKYFGVEKLPILGSGKLDLNAAKAMANALLES